MIDKELNTDDHIEKNLEIEQIKVDPLKYQEIREKPKPILQLEGLYYLNQKELEKNSFNFKYGIFQKSNLKIPQIQAIIQEIFNDTFQTKAIKFNQMIDINSFALKDQFYNDPLVFLFVIECFVENNKNINSNKKQTIYAWTIQPIEFLQGKLQNTEKKLKLPLYIPCDDFYTIFEQKIDTINNDLYLGISFQYYHQQLLQNYEKYTENKIPQIPEFHWKNYDKDKGKTENLQKSKNIQIINQTNQKSNSQILNQSQQQQSIKSSQTKLSQNEEIQIPKNESENQSLSISQIEQSLDYEFEQELKITQQKQNDQEQNQNIKQGNQEQFSDQSFYNQFSSDQN
ncbi:hypothetical protein PPERSA_02589 [Pseudocohnilembus persalinus]|uniref:Uncharacterized protein n=1 Tax=Pseudocohnilembus persalinus TaxID=266149 RepID=A0A0V0R669_PSEPJ|nr:hypothetical protein PPERSA_02589 [Pseudocohnilembus persalinus]|eukprot:KRX09717.1 hypothetical protein PPERSA_02589 [Pseudocohnilembus persalinus]